MDEETTSAKRAESRAAKKGAQQIPLARLTLKNARSAAPGAPALTTGGSAKPDMLCGGIAT